MNWDLQISRVTIQLRSRAKTKMSQLVTFLKSWQLNLFPLCKAWKFYEIQAKINGKSRRAPVGTCVLGGGIEIPCQYTIIGPKIHKNNSRKELRKAQLETLFL